MTKYIVATVAEIPPGSRKIVEISGRSIGVFNIEGDFYALRNRCPHQGGPLCQGKFTGLIQSTKPGQYDYSRPGEIIRCPWHGWEFDVQTGQSWVDPAQTRVRRYDVQRESGADLQQGNPDEATTWVKGPYVAETYPVSIEEEYVVVELG